MAVGRPGRAVPAGLLGLTGKALPMAGYFEWMDSYSVGDDELDADHRCLISIINRFIVAVADHRTGEVTDKILEELTHYTVDHFRREEEVMRRVDFPDYLHHRSAHDRLTRQVAEFSARWRSGQEDPAGVAEFLMDWLLHHILEEDMKYSFYLRKPPAPLILQAGT